MIILNWLTEKWKRYRLNHHDCERNLVLLENYKTRTTNINGSYGETTISMCKCKICGKRVDID